ncbi:ribonuclease H-like domain-containing protein, partial [Lentinula raphanica]
IEVYTDGSCVHNGTDEASAGAGIHFPGEEFPDCAIKLPTSIKQSNQTGEIIGIKEAVEAVNLNADLTIHSDSKTCIEAFTKNLQKWEDNGYMGVANHYEIQATVAKLRGRKGCTTFKWVKGHAGNQGNEKADRLANEGRQKTQPDEIDLSIERTFKLTGAKLKTITQSLAQKFIRRRKMQSQTYQKAIRRRDTQTAIEQTKAGVKEVWGLTPTDEAIWKSLRHKDFDHKTRIFLWMAMHNGYKIGKYWEKITDYQDRALCTHCNTTESMEHILLACQAPGQRELWDLTKQLWERTGQTWVDLSMGAILGCGLADIRNEKGERLSGKSRLWRILVSETAYLIWKLRCER